MENINNIYLWSIAKIYILPVLPVYIDVYFSFSLFHYK